MEWGGIMPAIQCEKSCKECVNYKVCCADCIHNVLADRRYEHIMPLSDAFELTPYNYGESFDEEDDE